MDDAFMAARGDIDVVEARVCDDGECGQDGGGEEEEGCAKVGAAGRVGKGEVEGVEEDVFDGGY